MRTAVASDDRADDPAAGPGGAGRTVRSDRVRVWDVPVRVVHWLLVLCFAGAWLTAERDDWRLLHETLGCTFGGLLAFRLVWGLIGTRHARFASFVRGPRAVARYLKRLLGGTPEHHLGHNPAGAWAIVGLLALGIAVAASGWALQHERWGEAFEKLHDGAANALLLLVGVHVAGVLVSSRLHGERLVAAMLHGFKRQPAGTQPAPPGVRRFAWLGALVLAAVLGFWAVQARSPIVGGPVPGATAGDGERDVRRDGERTRHDRAARGHGDDDDRD